MAIVNYKRLLGNEPEAPDYRNSKEFEAFCSTIVELVRKAEKKRIDATYRYINSKVDKHRLKWVYEAVEQCKRDGLLYEASRSVKITIFRTGGEEIKPDGKPFDASVGFNAPKNKKMPPFAQYL